MLPEYNFKYERTDYEKSFSDEDDGPLFPAYESQVLLTLVSISNSLTKSL